MVQLSGACGWKLEVERGPDWLFVRPCPVAHQGVAEPLELVEQIWSLLEQNFTHRLVLELDAVERLDSHLIGQLLSLDQRIHECDGLLRVCGLSGANADLLRRSRLDTRFPGFRDRAEAVMGSARPCQPR